jgi:hypothetical protein
VLATLQAGARQHRAGRHRRHSEAVGVREQPPHWYAATRFWPRRSDAVAVGAAERRLSCLLLLCVAHGCWDDDAARVEEAVLTKLQYVSDSVATVRAAAVALLLLLPLQPLLLTLVIALPS